MIAILIDQLTNPSQEIYFKKFSDLIVTTNPDYKYLDIKTLTDRNLLEKYCYQNKIDGILKINANETIKHISLDNFDLKTNFVCVSDGIWIKKQKRFFSNRLLFKEQSSQQILIHNSDTKFKSPILDNSLKDLINLYQKKDYKKFVLESEKWVFHNSTENQNQIMIRYYCSLIYNFKLNNIKKSLEHIGIAIFLAPSMCELWCAWGDVLLDNKFYEKSLQIYKNAITVKQNRDIFDTQPIWIDRNEKYAEKMYASVKKTIDSIKIVISSDQNNSSSSLTTTVT
jgi:tetratricopeptide (TPR) repeat protein